MPRAVVISVGRLNNQDINNIKNNYTLIAKYHTKEINNEKEMDIESIYDEDFKHEIEKHSRILHLTENKISPYSLYFTYQMEDGENMEFDTVIPTEEGETNGGGLIKSEMHWFDMPNMVGLNILKANDTGMYRFGIGSGKMHLMKTKITKRIYQKKLIVILYDNIHEKTLQYIKIEGFTQCPYITDSLTKQYANMVLSLLFNHGKAEKEFIIKESCKNHLFNR